MRATTLLDNEDGNLWRC